MEAERREAGESSTQAEADARLVSFCEAIEKHKEEEARIAKLWLSEIVDAWHERQGPREPTRGMNVVIEARVGRAIEAIRRTQEAERETWLQEARADRERRFVVNPYYREEFELNLRVQEAARDAAARPVSALAPRGVNVEALTRRWEAEAELYQLRLKIEAYRNATPSEQTYIREHVNPRNRPEWQLGQ